MCAAARARAEGIEARGYEGRPLSAALDDLREHGLRLIYSSDLVRPDMIVANDPAAGSPRSVLDQLLEPFGLRAQDGPRGSLLVVRAPPSAAGTEAGAEGAHRVPAFREEIEVSSTPTGASSDRPEAAETLGPGELSDGARFGEDPSRAMAWLPGISAADKSAQFGIRGSGSDETQFILDGLIIDDPYHLKDFLGFSSIIDARTLQGADLLRGLFPAEYGGRMSGVVDLSTVHPSGPRRSALTLGSIDSGYLTQAGFRDRSGGWLLSTRAFRPDALVDTVDPGGEGLNPEFYDLFAKVETTVANGTLLSGHVLMARDSVHAAASPDQGRVAAGDDSDYAWLSAQTPWTDRLYSRTVLSVGRSARERQGGFADPGGASAAVVDERASSTGGLSQDWLFETSPTSTLGWGLVARRVGAQYDTLTRSARIDPLFTGAAGVTTDNHVELDPQGTELGVYLTDRFHLARSIGVEIGARWDRQTLTSEDEISPRVNLVWAPGPRTAVRFGWGRVYQPQGPQELQAEDGATTFFPAERAEHRTINFDHRFAGGLGLSVGAYSKAMSNLRPRYENLFNPMVIFPEAEPDRVYVAPGGALARGLEVALSMDRGGGFAWRAGYALARADEEIDGRMVPRDFDQRHTLDVALHFRRGTRWDFILAGQYHSGWPTTGVEATAVRNADGSVTILPVLGPRNSERLPTYHRLDLNVGRRIDLGRGSLRLFLQVTNLYGRDNVCCAREFDYTPRPDGTVRVERKDGFWLRRLPVFGLTWESAP